MMLMKRRKNYRPWYRGHAKEENKKSVKNEIYEKN